MILDNFNMIIYLRNLNFTGTKLASNEQDIGVWLAFMSKREMIPRVEKLKLRFPHRIGTNNADFMKERGVASGSIEMQQANDLVGQLSLRWL